MRSVNPIVSLLGALRQRPKTEIPDVDDARFVPAPLPDRPGDAENLAGWGFADTRFEVNDRGYIVLTGKRYNLCGTEMPHLLRWMAETTSSPISPMNVLESSWPNRIERPRRNERFLRSLRAFMADDQITEDDVIRQRHGHGHTQEEIYRVNYGELGRVPDLVVYPRTTLEVERIVEAAVADGVMLVPFGGGTNVTDALRCPEDERRTIVSVDMRQMNRVLWIDPVNRLACIQAGAAGRDIFEILGRYNLTMGHEPDSVEFSTLGGWIATNASGMKKNRYGNIEDLVVDVEMVTARGTMTREHCGPRESIGVDPRRMVFGSEGCLGIITQAIVKVFPLPEVASYASFLFPEFPDGFAFLYDLARTGQVPASLRLLDNTQFHFGQALKPFSEGVAAMKSQVESQIVQMRGYDPDKLVVATLVFEGSKQEVAAQRAAATAAAARHGGMAAGAANGERGYQLTFGIAYIRDFIFRHQMIAESFETSVPWSHAERLFERVKERSREEHIRLGLPGTPFVTGRVTQVYENGVCCYFYLGFYAKGVSDPVGTYRELEDAVREEILACGGSLSHHHGIGKIRKDFLPRIYSEASLDLLRHTKRAFDPNAIFGARNQAFSEEG